MLPTLPSVRPPAAYHGSSVDQRYIGVPLPVKTRTLQMCLERAAGYYRLPVLLLDAIVWQEGGTDGVGDRDPNGSYDLGIAQINTGWLPVFSKYGITEKSLLDNPCENLYAAAYVLATYGRHFGGSNWFEATMAYNVGPNGLADPALYRIGYAYARNVMWKWHILYERVHRQTNFYPESFPGR